MGCWKNPYNNGLSKRYRRMTSNLNGKLGYKGQEVFSTKDKNDSNVIFWAHMFWYWNAIYYIEIYHDTCYLEQIYLWKEISSDTLVIYKNDILYNVILYSNLTYMSVQNLLSLWFQIKIDINPNNWILLIDPRQS